MFVLLFGAVELMMVSFPPASWLAQLRLFSCEWGACSD